MTKYWYYVVEENGIYYWDIISSVDHFPLSKIHENLPKTAMVISWMEIIYSEYVAMKKIIDEEMKGE